MELHSLLQLVSVQEFIMDELNKKKERAAAQKVREEKFQVNIRSGS